MKLRVLLIVLLVTGLSQVAFTQPNLKMFIDSQSKRQDEVKENEERTGRDAYVFKIKSLDSICNKSLDSVKSWYRKERDSIRNLNMEDYVEDQEIEKLRRLREGYDDEIKTERNRNAIDVYDDFKEDKSVRFFPVLNGYTAALHYNTSSRFNFFENTSAKFGSKIGSVETEIATGYAWFFRLSLSSVLSRQEAEKVDAQTLKGFSDGQVDSVVAAVQKRNEQNNTLVKVISNGGEANITVKTPIVDMFGSRNAISIKSDLMIKGSADLPTAGNAIPGDQANLFYTVAAENRVLVPINDYDSRHKSFTSFALFGNADLKYVGGTKTFHQSINHSKNFAFLEYSAGIVIKNLLVFYNRQLFFDSELSNQQKGRLGVSLITQL